jgi:hypothetical protein
VVAAYPQCQMPGDLSGLVWSRSLLIDRVLDLCGIRLSTMCHNHWAIASENEHRGKGISTWRFSQIDIAEIETKVSHLNLIDLSDGMALYYEGSNLPRTFVQARDRLHSMARQKLQRFCETFPGSLDTLLKLGNVFLGMAQSLGNSRAGVTERRQEFLQAAMSSFDAILQERCSDSLRAQVLLVRIRTQRKLGDQAGALTALDALQAMEMFRDEDARICFERALTLLSLVRDERTHDSIDAVEKALDDATTRLASWDELVHLGRSCIRVVVSLLHRGRGGPGTVGSDMFVRFGSLCLDKGLGLLGSALGLEPPDCRASPDDVCSWALKLYQSSADVRCLAFLVVRHRDGSIEQYAEPMAGWVWLRTSFYSLRVAALLPLLCAPVVTLFNAEDRFRTPSDLSILSRPFMTANGTNFPECDTQQIGPDGAKSFAFSLERAHHIRELSLPRAFWSQFRESELKVMFQRLPSSLRRLIAADYGVFGRDVAELGEEGFLVDALKGPLPSLQTLVLTKVGPHVLSALVQNLLPDVGSNLRGLGLGLTPGVSVAETVDQVLPLTQKLRWLAIRATHWKDFNFVAEEPSEDEEESDSAVSTLPAKLTQLHLLHWESFPLSACAALTKLEVLDLCATAAPPRATRKLVSNLPRLRAFRRPDGFIEAFWDPKWHNDAPAESCINVHAVHTGLNYSTVDIPGFASDAPFFSAAARFGEFGVEPRGELASIFELHAGWLTKDPRRALKFRIHSPGGRDFGLFAINPWYPLDVPFRKAAGGHNVHTPNINLGVALPFSLSEGEYDWAGTVSAQPAMSRISATLSLRGTHIAALIAGGGPLKSLTTFQVKLAQDAGRVCLSDVVCAVEMFYRAYVQPS